MALHPSFPASPYDIADPDHRWRPDPEQGHVPYEKLLPPLVAKIRDEVSRWRGEGYPGASKTSRALLRWWFDPSLRADGTEIPFRYYFAQREAVETVVWLYEVKKARDKHALLPFDSSGAVSANMFMEELPRDVSKEGIRSGKTLTETWPRYVCKMATGSGKTKVLSLLIAWSWFHKLYEADSTLSRNFLLIAPNIIVLDRLRTDFDGLRIFFNDPVLPDNGFEGQNWREDFQITVHLQDDVRLLRPVGNLFLTNIHRVYLGDVREPSLEDDDLRDYYLAPFGPKPVGKTTDSKTDLGEIVRDIDELAVFNDEAHHVHDERMAWFGSIRDIHHRLVQKDKSLSLQLDVTATPKHDNGSIFVHTVSDYPLVEAIYQNVVKHPTLPDQASLDKLSEKQSAIFSERYSDYLRLGVEEWRRSFTEHQKLGKKAVLFVMVDDTKNCDDVGAYLEKIAPELANAVLVIHTKKNGDISEAASGKAKEELERLRKAANEIDDWKSPYKAIVSVLMLKEGWDVRNVTTIVGLRAYSAESHILPEQTLGRGLRRMYFGSDVAEHVSVIGSPTFIGFVEKIKKEGVQLEYRPIGDRTSKPTSLIVEVDRDNPGKNIEALDIAIPRLGRRFEREYKALTDLAPAAFLQRRLSLKDFASEGPLSIDFKTMLDDAVHHTIELDLDGVPDWRSAIGFFARQLMKEARLVSGYEILYPKIRDFVRNDLFEGAPVDLEDAQVLRNLADPTATKLVFDAFIQAINALSVRDRGVSSIDGYIRLSEVRPFRMGYREHLTTDKSVFNKIVPEAERGGFELTFAHFLDDAKDVTSFAKNYLAVGFKLDYVDVKGDIVNYIPDFIVKTNDGDVWIIETKGAEELNLPNKMKRLAQWCADATEASRAKGGPSFRFIYVDQKGFEAHRPTALLGLAASFRDYQSP